MAIDWSSLPSDLLRRIGDHHLAAGDIDCYMDMRSVCNSWRSAISKPRPLGAGADLRFRPRQWVMLDEKESQEAADGRRLFVNVSTGRFLRRRVPMLHDHHLLAASHGLLVLREKSYPHTTRILDPFTGSTLVRAPDVREDDGMNMMTVYFVPDPGSELRAVQFPHYSEDRIMYYVHSVVTYAGHVYVVDSEGCMFRILGGEERPSFGYGDLIARMDFGGGMYLVESAGELLLVRLHHAGGAAEVYRVDVERKVVESLPSIGSRALFLGSKCLSVDADKFVAIDPNCVYHTGFSFGDGFLPWLAAHRYDLGNGGEQEDVSDDLDVNTEDRLVGPPSLVKVLLDYCNLLADQ
ncbi:hypothetical protein QYE76_058794 [Lolium multiflorum]|uniref:KIB1-4 beta-propeller domain-containing protein n=1 Tax=Lolium multiflorum TaxID=4521 RepID=A0AAD8T7S6_LOLMU|nr:hypothetical protein QYE76_058794 [Lolium multiflorum]